jgi:hypothetical protein
MESAAGKKWTMALLHGLDQQRHTETEFPDIFSLGRKSFTKFTRDFESVPDVRTTCRYPFMYTATTGQY